MRVRACMCVKKLVHTKKFTVTFMGSHVDALSVCYLLFVYSNIQEELCIIIIIFRN